MTAAPTADRVIADIGRILEIDTAEIDVDANPADLGLDSVRVIALVEQWRSEGLDVDLVDLISAPTVEDWVRVLGLAR